MLLVTRREREHTRQQGAISALWAEQALPGWAKISLCIYLGILSYQKLNAIMAVVRVASLGLARASQAHMVAHCFAGAAVWRLLTSVWA